MILALTGATGFLGHAIVQAARAAGHEVRALSRRGDLGPGVVTVTGGLSDASALRELVGGADAVIHCAGLTQAADPADLMRVNRDGTRAVAEAASAAGAARFVLISSLAARSPQVSAYAASKAAGEATLREAFPTRAAIILRPGAIYGPGDEATAPLMALARRGWAPLPTRRDGAPTRFSLIFVADAAEAALAAATIDRAPEDAVPLHDGRAGGYGWAELWATASKALDRRVRTFPWPEGVARALARLEETRFRLFRGRATLTTGKVEEMFATDWVVDADAPELPGWRARVTLEDGLARTFAAMAREKTG